MFFAYPNPLSNLGRYCCNAVRWFRVRFCVPDSCPRPSECSLSSTPRWYEGFEFFLQGACIFILRLPPPSSSRFRSATRGIRLHGRDVRSQQEEAPAAGRRTADDRAARERQDSGHRRRGSRRGSGDGRATRKRSKSRGGGAGAGGGDNETPSRRRAPIQRVRSFGSDSSFKSMAKNLAESTSFRHGRERYQVAPKNRPSPSGERPLRLYFRGRVFFVSLILTFCVFFWKIYRIDRGPFRSPPTYYSRLGGGGVSARAGVSVFLFARHHLCVVFQPPRPPPAPVSYCTGGDAHERRTRKRSSTSRNDQGRGATTSSSGAPRPRRGESSTARRGERRDRDKSRGRGVDGTTVAFASKPSRSRRGTARGGGGAGGPAKSRREEDGERPYSPGSNFSDGSIVVPTVRACASVGRPATRLSDMLAGNVVSNSSMRRGSSGNRQADVPVLDLRSHSTGGGRSREPVGARAGRSGGGGGGGGAAAVTTVNDDAEASGGGRDERRRSRDSGGGSRSSGRSSGGGVRAEDYGAPRSKAKGNRERSGSAGSSGGGGDRGSTGKDRRQQEEDGATTNPDGAGSPREKAHPFVVGMGDPPGGSDDDEKGGNNGGSLSFSNNGDGNDVGDGDSGGGRLTRGRTKYRQSRSSRARERAYQETRSRSRGSSMSTTSLQRVVEVSEESLSSVSPEQMNPALAGRYSSIASAAAAGEGRRRRDDGSHDDDDEEATDRRMFPPPSAAGSDVDFHSMMDGTVDSGESSSRPDSCSRSVPPSSAPRFHVSEIKMPGNAAGLKNMNSWVCVRCRSM